MTVLLPIEESDEDGDGYVAVFSMFKSKISLGLSVIVGDSDCNPEDGSAFSGPFEQ